MGYQASCTLRFDGNTVRGTAWLEHKDLVFRGPTRLAIPLNTITAASADDGTLRIQFGDRDAQFDIGADAVKWARRITNPPSRMQKLGVKAGATTAVVGISEAEFLAELSRQGAEVIRQPANTRQVDTVFYGVESRDGLERLRPLQDIIKPHGAIWVVRPKGLRTITESDTMAAGKRAGLVDVKVVSFSETHTAEKFVIPVAKRAASARSSPSIRKRGSATARSRT